MAKDTTKGMRWLSVASRTSRRAIRTTTKTVGVLLLCAVLMTLASVPVSAVTLVQQPDVFKIDAIYAYQSLIENGDQCYVMDQTTAYTVTTAPTTPISTNYLVRMFDTDGVTVLAATTPYAWPATGYGQGIVIIYLTAADAPTWSSNYTFQLIGNPGVSWNGTPPVKVSGVSYWSVTTGTAAQAELALKILKLAGDLNGAWGLTGTNLLTQSTTAGTKLSTNGITYFTGLQSNLQSLAPNAFASSIIQPNTTSKKWGMTNATVLAAQLTGTPLDFSGLATATHIPIGWLNSIITLLVMAVIDYFIKRKNGNTKGLILIDDFIFIGASVIGFLPLAVVLGAGIFALFITLFVTLYNRSIA